MPAAAVALLGFARGGYYPTAWAWATIAALALGVGPVVRSRTLALARLEWVLLGGLAAFALWTLAGVLRPGAATRGAPVLERTVLYVAVALAALQLARRTSADAALAGVLTGIVAVVGSGLATLLLPRHVRADAFEGRLLFLPVGYANACGILAALGVLLALGFASRRDRWPRVLAAAVLVPLVVALDLTGSRGALVAAACGFVVVVALDGSRRTAAAAALYLPAPLLAAALASASSVGAADATTSVVARDGRLVGAAVVLLTAAQAATALRLHGLIDRGLLRRAALGAVAACSLLAFALVAARGAGSALGDRPLYWHAAWADARAHPLAGSGPGSFAAEWLQRRPARVSALNAHSLYLETLAELGVPGLALLLLALLAPLAALRRARSATAAGCYVAFLLHAGLDWDWQLPVVVVAGVVCGACLLAHGDARLLPAPRWTVAAAVAASALLAIAAAAAGVGNRTLASAVRSGQAGSTADAARLARLAAVWQPWSAVPQRLLGETALAAGDAATARTRFERAVRLDPRDTAAWTELALAGDPEERARALGRLERLDPLTVGR